MIDGKKRPGGLLSYMPSTLTFLFINSCLIRGYQLSSNNCQPITIPANPYLCRSILLSTIMKADKNTIIGFVLLGILFFVYFWYTNKQQSAMQASEKRAQDSIAAVNAAKAKVTDPNIARLDSLQRDSLTRLAQAGSFDNAAIGTEQTTVVENSL